MAFAKWEVELGGEWKPLGKEERQLLDTLVRKGETSGQMLLRGHQYIFDVGAMLQTNVSTGRSRSIRNANDLTIHAELLFSNGQTPPTSPTIESRRSSPPTSPFATTRCVEVWLLGEWKRLSAQESAEIARQEAAGNNNFVVESRGFQYSVDLKQMTQTNLRSGRTRTIRVIDTSHGNGTASALGFEAYREGFRERASGGDKPELREEDLVRHWPASQSVDTPLLHGTASKIISSMDLRKTGSIDMVQWNHFWAMERDSPSFHAGLEVNEKIAQALRKDPQVLGRMQMHFETAVGESGSIVGLSKQGLIKACQRLVDSPQKVIEKRWADEVLQREEDGEGLEEDVELSYYDFLNIMLGRKKFNVYLYMYDISNGVAANFGWMLVGQRLEGIWHSGVVVEWRERSSEFWYGGRIFESVPGSTPFGTPLQKRPIGHTYKSREEVWNYVSQHLARKYTQASYDVLTHNCNHAADELSIFLMNEHIPNEVRLQPEQLMNTLAARLLRPLLNRWLGNFGAVDGRATDEGAEAKRLWDEVLPGALIEFSREKGGRPLVGKVEEASEEGCVVCCLDFWEKQAVSRDVLRDLVTQLLKPAPHGTKQLLELMGTQQQNEYCCNPFSVLNPFCSKT
eukprot:TRINITY_DN48922_c0_g1_i1.p1 TRINITY_DN48922_c0_g1~~TRINITY_DN48922_c0_g1_i1.p1  ORF type:complete len:626 (-),score=109.28 TRINITY_DN48922_c0_g1_i1:16-1893(-)